MKNKIIWPGNKKFAVCLTHDVDRVRKTYQYLTHPRINNLLKMRKLLKSKNPYWNFKTIVDIENKLGVRSTFFFLQESKKLNFLKPNEWVLSGGKYRFNEEKISKIIQFLDKNYWEIGLHGSYNSYRNIELLKTEKRLLERVVGHQIYGIRQHYLNLSTPKTWKIQKTAGFKYDSSFGLKNDIGFKEGKIFPFRPFKDKKDFVVIPLVVMDSYLFKLSSNVNEAWEKIKSLISYTEKHGALLTVLWHQREFNEKEFPGYIEIYKKLIKLCLNKEAYFGRCKDI
ncbi:MAG: polysaccharide deacetylase family protein, partial [Promethearchaeota archaeon]